MFELCLSLVEVDLWRGEVLGLGGQEDRPLLEQLGVQRLQRAGQPAPSQPRPVHLQPNHVLHPHTSCITTGSELGLVPQSRQRINASMTRQTTNNVCPLESKWSFDITFSGNGVDRRPFLGLKTASNCCNQCRACPALDRMSYKRVHKTYWT